MKLAVMFNGQGSHYQGMGLDFEQAYAESKAVFDSAEQISNLPIRHWIAENDSQLKITANAQITISAVSLAIFRAIEKQLPTIDAFGGLSLGEYSALIASGHFEVSTAWQLLLARGKIMSDICEQLPPSQMIAVIKMPLATIQQLVQSISQTEDLYIANYNSTEQIILGGSISAIEQFKQQALALGYKKILPLKVEGPFHTPMMREAQRLFSNVIQQVKIENTATLPLVWSNVTAQPHQATLLAERLIDHLVQPVQWSQTIDAWINQGITHIIQIGPGQTLKKLLQSQYPDVHCLAIDKVADCQQVADFLKER